MNPLVAPIPPGVAPIPPPAAVAAVPPVAVPPLTAVAPPPAIVGAVPPPQYVHEIPVVPQPDQLARPGTKDQSTEADDRMIKRFAKIVLKRPQHVQLAALIGKDEPEFTLDEFKVLAPYKGNPDYMGTGVAGPDSAPYCQLYDFCRTVREVFGELRHLKSRVDNLEGTTNIDELASLKKQIHHISYVPWALLEAMPTTSELYDASISPTKYRLGEDVKPDSKAKTPYDKAVDIAMLLRSPVVNSMVALTQGLFKTYLTTRDDVSEGWWVNGLVGGDPRWDLTGNNTGYLDVLRPHPTEMKYYPNNWIANELCGWKYPNDAHVNGWVGNAANGQFPIMTPLPAPNNNWINEKGGAVSQWVFARSNTQIWPTRPNDELPVSDPVQQPAPGANMPNTRTTIAVQLTNNNANGAVLCQPGDYNAANAPNGIPVHALQINWKSVMNTVKMLHNDPIYAIAQLSDAYNMSGLADYVMSKYQAIQRLFSAKMQQLRQGREMRDVRSLWKAVQFSAPETGSCPADSMTMYRSVTGGGLQDEKAATEVINGVRYLKNGYLAGSKQCVPLHRVSDNEITEKSDVDLGLHGMV